jgi:hypothetical protein
MSIPPPCSKASAISIASWASFRTLLPESDRLQLAGTLNRTILGNVSATGNATFTANDTESRFGLAPGATARALTRESESRDGHLGLALNGDIRPGVGRSPPITIAGITSPAPTGATHRPSRSGGDEQPGRQCTARAERLLFPHAGGRCLHHLPDRIERQDLEANRRAAAWRSKRPRTHARRRAGEYRRSDRKPAQQCAGCARKSFANFNAEIERYSDFGPLRTVGGGLNWSRSRS